LIAIVNCLKDENKSIKEDNMFIRRELSSLSVVVNMLEMCFVYIFSLNNIHKNIFCTNIRSVNANFDEFMLFLEYEKKYKIIDIFILNKTWHIISNFTLMILDYNI